VQYFQEAIFSKSEKSGKKYVSGVINKLRDMKSWHILLLAVVLSETFTALLSTVLLRGHSDEIKRITYFIGAVDSFVVSYIIGYLIVHFLNGVRKIEIESAEAMAYSERLYRAIVEDQAELISRFLPDGTITFANEALCRYYGLRKNEIIGRSIIPLLPEEERESLKNFFTSMTKENPAEKIENYIVLQATGEIRWQSWTHRAIFDTDGRVIEIQGVGRDITEQKEMEEVLQESERKYRLLFENMTTGFALHKMIYDEDGKPADYRYLEINPAFEKLTGVPESALIGKTVKEVLPKTEQYWIDIFGKVAQTGVPIAYQNYSGELGRCYDTWAFSPMKDQVAVIFSDITDRKRMGDKLKESEEKYRSFVETTDDSIYLVDRDCRYLFVNKKHQVRLGISNDTYIGRTYGEYHTSEESQWFSEKINKVFETGEAYQYEHMSNRDNNYFLQTLSPVISGNGEIIAVSVISKNITEFKCLQDKLRVLSITDDLTGLYNRRGFFPLAEHQLRIAARIRKGLFLFYADVDNLKEVNDKFGHLEGDQLIIKTAEVLKDNFRNSDIIARIGGDEFVIFPVEEGEGSPDIILDRLQNKINRINEETKNQYNLSLSIGKAYYDPLKPCSIEELLHQADMSMYQQKTKKNGD
jgi:diguanylate cyclase (GGDEF)-like protein/PAS domain S-box-containing protein